MFYHLYCCRLDECGYYTSCEDLPEGLICPECYYPLLVYEKFDSPSFIKEIPDELYPEDSDEFETPDNERPE